MPGLTKLLADLDRQRLRHLRELGVEMRHFYDVGASNGRWSEQVSQDFPQATFDLFEPLAQQVPKYWEHMQPTLASHPLFKLHQVALGFQCGRTRMYVSENPVGSTALELGDDAPPQWGRQEVEILTIDHIVRHLNRPMPDVLKVDTQGCELNVLQGASETLPDIKVLLLECWLTRGYGKTNPLLLEIAEWLREYDFHLWDLSDCYRDPAGILVSQDCLFLNARCAASPLKNEPMRFIRPARVAKPAPAENTWVQQIRNLLGRRASAEVGERTQGL